MTDYKEIALEIGNDLIKTLGSMPAHEADAIVKRSAERLIREIGGLKGFIKGGYGCILYKDGFSRGDTSYRFVEE